MKLKKLGKSHRSLCVTCGLLLLPDDLDLHKGHGHTIKSNITKPMLKHPTELFQPLDNNKTYAQYLFSSKSVDFVLETLLRLEVSHVLCIGCPRIHETICLQRKESEGSSQLTSLLLDLDHRYLQIYPPTKFCHYNMLNHHFFGGSPDEATFHTFVRECSSKKVAVVLDPPFGVMVEALAMTLNKVQAVWSEHSTNQSNEIPMLWFFPYFMEHRVKSSCPTFSMLDYKVDYDNHALFKGEKGRKKGSPVRIFTNLEPKTVPLPKDEGYWFCKRCSRYCSRENQHCDKCDLCTTKDGGTYKHCDVCGRCVKPSRVHCVTCGVCDLQDHRCGRTVSTGCHICGQAGHKRRECPNKGQQGKSQHRVATKRKHESTFRKSKSMMSHDSDQDEEG